MWDKILRFFGRKQRDDHVDGSAKKKHDDDGFCYCLPDEYTNLDEVEAPAAIENRHEDAPIYTHHTLEEERGGEFIKRHQH